MSQKLFIAKFTIQSAVTENKYCGLTNEMKGVHEIKQAFSSEPRGETVGLPSAQTLVTEFKLGLGSQNKCLKNC